MSIVCSFLQLFFLIFHWVMRVIAAIIIHRRILVGHMVLAMRGLHVMRMRGIHDLAMGEVVGILNLVRIRAVGQWWKILSLGRMVGVVVGNVVSVRVVRIAVVVSIVWVRIGHFRLLEWELLLILF
jgi:hypothetical protein